MADLNSVNSGMTVNVVEPNKGEANAIPMLQTVDGEGKPVHRRIVTAEACYRIYNDLKVYAYDWALMRARISGVYDGNPPYAAGELERLGQSYRCNVNFRELEATIDTNAAAAWELHMDNGNLIECKIPAWKLPTDGSGDEWADIIAEEYSQTLFDWQSFYFNVDTIIRECLKYGYGGAIWPDEWDWRSNAFKNGHVIMHSRAPANIEKLELVFVRSEMTVSELFALTEDSARARQAGWNVEEIKRLLISQYLSQANETVDSAEQDMTSPWESLQQAYRTYDTGVQAFEFLGIRVVHCLCQEPSSHRISHLIIPDVSTTAAFLFERRDRYDTMKNAIWFLPYSYGDGTLRSSKGLGHRSLPHVEFSNRFLCTMFDGGLMAASLLLQPKTAQDTQRLSLLRMGPVTIIPEGLQAMTQTFAPPIGNLISLRQLSKGILENNTAVYRPRPEIAAIGGQPEPQKTAQQVMTEQSKEARIERSQAAFFYVQWQLWHRETYRRLTNKEYLTSKIDRPGKKEALEFVLRCMQRGVPGYILMDPTAVKVRVAKAVGFGSVDSKMAAVNRLQAMKPAMDERGRKNADREWASVNLGSWAVDRFFPLKSRDSMPSNETSVAVLEDDMMELGKAVVSGQDQTHVIHFTQHGNRAEQYVEAAKNNQLQGESLEAAGNFLERVFPHMAEHVKYLAQDPTRMQQVVVYQQFMGSLANPAKLIIKAAQQYSEAKDAQEKQQSGQPALDQDHQVQLAKVQADKEVDGLKIQLMHQDRVQKSAAQAQLKREVAAANLKLDAEKQAAQLQMEGAKAQAKIQIDAAKSVGQ